MEYFPHYFVIVLESVRVVNHCQRIVHVEEDPFEGVHSLFFIARVFRYMENFP